MLNLLSNACKFQQSGEISVKAKYEKDKRKNSMFINVEVQDRGIGMTHEKVIGIFKPFNEQNTEVRGNGVGLSICK